MTCSPWRQAHCVPRDAADDGVGAVPVGDFRIVLNAVVKDAPSPTLIETPPDLGLGGARDFAHPSGVEFGDDAIVGDGLADHFFNPMVQLITTLMGTPAAAST